MPTQQQEIEFNNLLSRNYPNINSICLRFCGGNAFYFDELRQECALALWTEYSKYGLSRFRGDSTESTWIYQISYHAIAHYLRNPKHKESPTIRDMYAVEYIANNDEKNDWNLIDDLMEHLNNKERNLLDHYLKDDSYSTIAYTEGITESNARKRMSRLLTKLKMLISEK